MAKDRGKKTKVWHILSVPVKAPLLALLKEEAQLDERMLSDTCRRLWMEAIRARSEFREPVNAVSVK